MSFSIDLAALLERAAQRAAEPGYPATVATRLPDAEGSQVAGVAGYPAPAQRCADCRHLSRVKTCTTPVAAGLLTAAEGFGIAWPPAGYGATCQAWRRNPAEAVLAVYTAAGRGGWPDALMHQWLSDADEHPDAVLDVMTNGGPTP